MALDLDRVGSAFNKLPVMSDSEFLCAFSPLVEEGKLRYLDHAGAPELLDLVDDLSARLICSVLRARAPSATLIVFPDELERRGPFLFIVALIIAGIAQIRARDVGGYILYLANHAGIRSQFQRVQLGRYTLTDLFGLLYGRGMGDLTPAAMPGGTYLPTVLAISGPADPAALLRQHKPKWVAVDLGEKDEIAWLPGLLSEAKRIGIPVVGWTSKPLSGAIRQWLRAGGGVFMWPRLRRGYTTRVECLNQLAEWALEADVIPVVLDGRDVIEMSRAFARATEALLEAEQSEDGRLATDAVMLGWRYLRAMEAMAVPLEVYERETKLYWGMHRIEDLKRACGHFLDALGSASPKLKRKFQGAMDALSDAHDKLAKTESPLWLGLVNLCVYSSEPRRVLFSSRARREMFSFNLLAKFNISEDDLREVGVELGYLTERTANEAPLDESIPLLIGLPSRFGERHLEPFLQSGKLEVLIWPHQESVLGRQVQSISSQLEGASIGLVSFLPPLEEPRGQSPKEIISMRSALTLGHKRVVEVGAVGGELGQQEKVVALWKRPDAAEAIASLFRSIPTGDDEEESNPPGVLSAAAITETASQDTSDTIWVQDAVEILFEGGSRILLPSDETINVIVRNAGETMVEERYVRSLRPGDEILFIEGQRRQSLYDLLVSRVHRDPIIAQYLALIRRWQDDFVQAFNKREQEGTISVDSLLEELRKAGSQLTCPQTIRLWLRRLVLVPNDAEDLRRLSQVLSLSFVRQYYRQIHGAGRCLAGLHRSLSVRLNRWLASGEAASVAIGDSRDIIDEELGLTMDDFRHSLLRLRVFGVRGQTGPFYRPHMGRLEGGR